MGESLPYSRPDMAARRFATDLGVATLLALVGAGFFHGVLQGRRLYAVDLHQTYEPLRQALTSALRGGSLLWTSRLHAGMPLLANPMAGAAYPLNYLPLGSPATALSLLTVGHVLFGALGAFALARTWKLSLPAAWCAGAGFGFNGITVSATAYPNLCWSLAWLPWLLLAWERAGAASGRRRLGFVLLFAAAVFGLVVQGEPFTVLGGATGLLLLAVRDLASGARPRAVLAPALAGGLLAGLLVAPFLWAAARYLPLTERGAGFPRQGLVYWSAHPALAAGLALPQVFGDPEADGAARFWPERLVPEKGFPLLAGLYLGSAALALLLLGASVPGPRRVALLTWAGLLFLLALGRYGPLYGGVTRLPFAHALRFPMKWLVPAALPLSLLAGLGMEAIKSRRRLALALAGVMLVGCVAAGLSARALVPLATAHHGAEAVARIHRSAVLGALPLLAMAGALLAGARFPRGAAVALALVVTADLAWANRTLAPTVPDAFYRTVPPVVAALRASGGTVGRVWVESPMDSKAGPVPPPAGFASRARWEREVLLGYTGASYGLDLAFTMDVGHFRPRLHARLAAMVHSAPPREKLMLLGAGGVTHLIHHTPISDPRLIVLQAFPGSTRPLLLSRNGLAAPRLRVVSRLVPYDGEQGFMRAVLHGPDDLFLHAALVAREEVGTLPLQAGGMGTARLLEDGGARLRIEVRGDGGYLVIADSFVPGWSATEDGRPIPILRADVAFRAVPVWPGTHEVVMRYAP